MKRWSLVLIGLLVFFLAGCAKEPIAPDVFIKESWTNTYQMEFEQMGQKMSMVATLALDPTERQQLLDTLPYNSPLRQMPFGVLLQTDLKANFEANIRLNKDPLIYGGEMMAHLDLGMMTQSFPMEMFMDLSGPEGGMFFSIGNIWNLAAPYAHFQASMADVNLDDPSVMWNWEEYKKSLPEEQVVIIEKVQTTFFNHLAINLDESSKGLRTIEADLQLAPFFEELVNELDQEEFWANDQLFSTLTPAEREELRAEWAKNKEEFTSNAKTYTEGVQMTFRWVADEKKKIYKNIDFTLKIGQDAEMMKQLSTLMQLDQPIHPILSLEMHSELNKLTEPQAVRPTSFTQEQQQHLIEQDRQTRKLQIVEEFSLIKDSIEIYYESNGNLPVNLSALEEDSYYLLPMIDPFSNLEYEYEVTDNQYRFFSVGPDGKPNTEDDIVLEGTM